MIVFQGTTAEVLFFGFIQGRFWRFMELPCRPKLSDFNSCQSCKTLFCLSLSYLRGHLWHTKSFHLAKRGFRVEVNIRFRLSNPSSYGALLRTGETITMGVSVSKIVLHQISRKLTEHFPCKNRCLISSQVRKSHVFCSFFSDFFKLIYCILCLMKCLHV